jgi:hypothetical protein
MRRVMAQATTIVWWAAVAGVLGLLVGCTIRNPAFLEDDAGRGPDVSADTGTPVPDVPALDAPAAEAPTVDAPTVEAPAAEVAGPDAPPEQEVLPAADGPSPSDADVAPAEVPPADIVSPPDGAAACTVPSNGSGTGLSAEYFDNSDFTGKRVSRIDDTIDWNFGLESPDPGLDADNFSARWTGQLQPVFSGPHTFTTSYDDGMRMFLDERVVIYRWGPRITTGQDSATVVLEAGRKYDLRFEFYDQGSAAIARLSWANPCQPTRQPIPKKQLYPVAPAAPVCAVERAPGSGTGLKFAFYAGATPGQGTVAASGNHARLDFAWGTGAPMAGVPADFSARWTGTLEAPIDGPLTIYLSTDDVGRLRFAGAPLLDSWSEPFGPQEVAATIDVRSGQRYPLSIELRDDTGAAFIHFSWSWPCHPKEIVPTHRLYLQ